MIKMIIKRPKPYNETCFQDPQSCCLTRLIWIPRFTSRYIDTKHQLADILTKGNFTDKPTQNDGEKDAGPEGR